MAQRVYDVLPDGTEVLTGVNLIAKPVDFDLTQEGRRYSKVDREVWRRARYEEQLPTLTPNPRSKKVSRERMAKLYSLTWRMPGMPTVGNFKPLQESPQLMAWLKRLEPYLPSEKRGMLMGRLWGILTGQRKGKAALKDKGNPGVLKSVLAFFFSVHDLQALADALFSHSVEDAAAAMGVEVPEVLRPLYNISSKVDGRGEVLATFLFRDVIWLPGTGKFDLESTDGKSKWHVKDMQGTKIRMGGSLYTASEVCIELMELTKDPAWQPVGKADVRYSLSKGLIAKNEVLLVKRYGSIPAFWERVNRAFQEAEVEARGAAFFNGTSVTVRLMKDVQCVGATKGDFEVVPAPAPSPSQNLSNVAA